MKSDKRQRRALLVAIGIGILSVGDVAAAADDQALQEIVVTARKRSENLQDVAVSVSALGVKDLAKRFETQRKLVANLVIDAA